VLGPLDELGATLIPRDQVLESLSVRLLEIPKLFGKVILQLALGRGSAVFLKVGRK